MNSTNPNTPVLIIFIKKYDLISTCLADSSKQNYRIPIKKKVHISTWVYDGNFSQIIIYSKENRWIAYLLEWLS